MREPDGLSGHDPTEQLARLQRLCRQRSVEVYRDQALYLQIMRDELRDCTRQALFRLISDVDPGRFSSLPTPSRSRFQHVVDDLIQRCSVLLTVEQLMHLVSQMQDEGRRRQARMGREMLKGLAQQQGELQAASTPAPGAREPSGSINLSLDLPINDPQGYTALPNNGPAEPAPEPMQEPDDQDGADSGELDVLRSLFQLAGDALEQVAGASDANATSLGRPDDSKAQAGLLPEMPDDLLRWMDAVDQALNRRLRNLSHAVNVQMLRSGLASTLLPITLLEAVLNGQVETQPAASNVLRLRLPMAIGEIEQGMDVLCLLLRSSEMEFDSHRLRRCRSRLRAHHRDLHTMVRQQRHWQRRYLDREAKLHWQTSSDPNRPPTNGD